MGRGYQLIEKIQDSIHKNEILWGKIITIKGKVRTS